jgi:DNA-binding response OmpR family regulator
MAEEGTTIVLAEDDVVLMDMYTERLKSEGFNVVQAHDGEAALKSIQEQHPQFIILDIMMPKMNGLDVLKAVKADETTKDTPVIIATALVQDMTEIKKMLGANDTYLIKSEVMPGDIIEIVKKKLNGEDAAEAPAKAPTEKD